MSSQDKASQILDSLREHIDEQKRLIDEENQRILQKGKTAFRQALLNDKLTLHRSNPLPAKISALQYIGPKLPHGLRQIYDFFRNRSQALHESLHCLAFSLKKTLKSKFRRIEPATRKRPDL
jgi:hypothetical protein